MKVLVLALGLIGVSYAVAFEGPDSLNDAPSSRACTTLEDGNELCSPPSSAAPARPGVCAYLDDGTSICSYSN